MDFLLALALVLVIVTAIAGLWLLAADACLCLVEQTPDETAAFTAEAQEREQL